MLCSACGAEVSADAAFCPKCGQQVSGAAVQPPAQAVAAAVSPVDRLRPGIHPVPHEEEKELWRGRYTPKAMYGRWVLAGIVTIGLAIVAILMPNPITLIAAAVFIPLAWILPAFHLLWLRLKYEYTLTTQRFLHKTGVF